MDDFALAFDSPLSFSEILERLDRAGGNLASVRTATLRLDLLESGSNESGQTVDAGAGRRYAVSVRAARDQQPPLHEWAALEVSLREELLPLVGATRIVATDPID